MHIYTYTYIILLSIHIQQARCTHLRSRPTQIAGILYVGVPSYKIHARVAQHHDRLVGMVGLILMQKIFPVYTGLKHDESCRLHLFAWHQELVGKCFSKRVKGQVRFRFVVRILHIAT